VDTVHECDRRTDRRTDRITITKTVLRIALHGKNRSIFDEDVDNKTVRCIPFDSRCTLKVIPEGKFLNAN